jgi:hypothetical protein
MACTDDGSSYYWASRCSINGDVAGYLTAFAQVGFHPFGDAPGIWLTQIFGQIRDIDNLDYSSFYNCPGQAYVTITYINNTTPIDAYGANTFLPGQHTEPTSGYLAYRTDNDLIKHGYDAACSGSNNTVHVDCPANHTLDTFHGETGSSTVPRSCLYPNTTTGSQDNSGALGTKVSQRALLVVYSLVLLLF